MIVKVETVHGDGHIVDRIDVAYYRIADEGEPPKVLFRSDLQTINAPTYRLTNNRVYELVANAANV